MGYLALAPHPMGRSRLCELLWDGPNDPRGELRWCLSRMRTLLDTPDRRRVVSFEDQISLDLSDCFVDAVEVMRATQAGVETVAPERLRALSLLFKGDFMEGLLIERCPHFSGWLVAQQHRFRASRVAMLEQLVKVLPSESDEVLGHLDAWLELAPFDRRAHEILLRTLHQRGQIREGQEHLSAAARQFEAEGLDWTPLREAWREARTRQAPAAPVVQVLSIPPRTVETSEPTASQSKAQRASIAVMPFLDRTTDGGMPGGVADGLTHDVITRLAKLRSLFVIGHGSVFMLGERGVGPQQAARALAVDFVTSGSLARRGDRIVVTAELTETRTARVIWAETYESPLGDAFLVLEQIGDRIVASIASEIETAERNRAILKPPNSLDAWEAYHRGLWHMYRYSQPENDRAQQFFEMAVRLDPTFARAYAALSFTHFQKAFLRWSDREPEIGRAFEAAGQALMADDRDPAARWAMGRALWLRGQHDQALVELKSAVDISPSFAHGHYTLAFVNAQSGDPARAIGSADHSRDLSPFDPLLFAILATRAMALVRLERFEEAADFAVKAAGRPNAFWHIKGIAAHCLALADRVDEARVVAASIRETHPHYRVDDLLATFQFAPDGEALFRQGARRIGIG